MASDSSRFDPRFGPPSTGYPYHHPPPPLLPPHQHHQQPPQHYLPPQHVPQGHYLPVDQGPQIHDRCELLTTCRIEIRCSDPATHPSDAVPVDAGGQPMVMHPMYGTPHFAPPPPDQHPQYMAPGPYGMAVQPPQQIPLGGPQPQPMSMNPHMQPGPPQQQRLQQQPMPQPPQPLQPQQIQQQQRVGPPQQADMTVPASEFAQVSIYLRTLPSGADGTAHAAHADIQRSIRQRPEYSRTRSDYEGETCRRLTSRIVQFNIPERIRWAQGSKSRCRTGIGRAFGQSKSPRGHG